MSEPNVRLAILTDLHLGPAASFGGQVAKLTHHAEPFLRERVAHWREEAKPDVILNLGDVLEDEDEQRDLARYGTFVSILAEAQIPVIHVAGNHDRIFLSDQQLLDLWQVTGPRPSALYYSRDLAGWHFSVLASEEHKDQDVRLPAEQLAWLEADLKSTSLPTVVCVHHPLSDCDLTSNRWFRDAPHICRVAERKKFRRIIEASGNVRIVVNGHAHYNHFDLIAGIPYITVQSPIENIGDANHPRPALTHGQVDMRRDRIHIRVFGDQPAEYQLQP